MNYTTTTIKDSFFVLPGLYFFYIPLWVPYDLLEIRATRSGFETDWSLGVIEKAAMFGRGWVGVKIKNPKTHQNVISVDAQYTAVNILGPYSQMKNVYAQIMQEHKDSKEYLNQYLNSPKDTAPEKLETSILFSQTKSFITPKVGPTVFAICCLFIGLLFAFAGFVLTGKVAIISSLVGLIFVLLSFLHI
jgi:hypothetical protein